ncbi:MAG: DinB family protein [Deltaproteobacteria bacterium]|jgi:hypothetical protein|nr:DinB family protein [Deltaproteobacteria bacterium]
MSRSVIDGLLPLVEDSLNFLTKLVSACPDDLWCAKAGLWPIWQHIVHAVSTVDFFLPYEAPLPLPAPLTAEVVRLSEIGSAHPTKEDILAFIQKGKEKTINYAATISDSDLAQPNDKLKAFNLNWSLGRSLTSIATHCQYHLGYADSLLRSNGRPGVF